MTGEDQEPTIDHQTALKLYVDMVNSERQAIWARNASMLIANAFILNSIRTGIAGDGNVLNDALFFAGAAICLIWAIMVWRGWGTFHRMTVEARDLVSGPLNPFHGVRSRFRRTHDVIFMCNLFLVTIFMGIYLAGIGQFLYTTTTSEPSTIQATPDQPAATH